MSWLTDDSGFTCKYHQKHKMAAPVSDIIELNFVQQEEDVFFDVIIVIFFFVIVFFIVVVTFFFLLLRQLLWLTLSSGNTIESVSCWWFTSLSLTRFQNVTFLCFLLFHCRVCHPVHKHTLKHTCVCVCLEQSGQDSDLVTVGEGGSCQRGIDKKETVKARKSARKDGEKDGLTNWLTD